MNPTEIIERMSADGLTLSVSEDGNLKILGDQNMVNSWIETIRENKAAILAELDASGKSCQRQNLHPLEATPVQQPFNERSSDRYSVTCTDASTDPVLVEVIIAGQASFTLEIPKLFYDGLALLEILEQHNETHSVMSGLSKETEGIDSRRAA